MSQTSGHRRPIDLPELDGESDAMESVIVDARSVVLSLLKVAGGTELVGSSLCVDTAVVL